MDDIRKRILKYNLAFKNKFQENIQDIRINKLFNSFINIEIHKILFQSLSF